MPCLIANAYMIHLYKRGLSRRANGGSLRQCAANISHLIRYCYNNDIDVIQMDNSRFTHFVKGLRAERDPINPEARKRDSNTLNSIGRSCLDFLAFVGRFNGEDDFVFYTVQAVRKTHRISVENSKKGFVEKESWHHESFDTPSSLKKRSPISVTSIQALYNMIPNLSSSKMINRRRVVMLRLLEMTDARIGEISSIKDIENAIQQHDPMLKMTTFKTRKKKDRYVPVLKQDLAALKNYIRIQRFKIIKNTIGAKNDHGFLFISEQTGQPLSSRYMSNEIGLLRRAAELTSGACAHMFRHRFITKLFVRLINQYDYENKDDFREALLGANILKQKIQQYTGHSMPSSMDHYIDLAFEEVADLQKIVSSVNLQTAYDTFDSLVEQLHRELQAGLPVLVYLEQYNKLLGLREEDTERLTRSESLH